MFKRILLVVDVQSHRDIAKAHSQATRKMYLVVLISVVALVAIILALFYVQNNVAGQAQFDGQQSEALIQQVSQDTLLPSTPLLDSVVVEVSCQDADLDGFNITLGDDPSNPNPCAGPLDCNDLVYSINPGAAEVCYDGVDNDCNALIDNDDPSCGLSLIAHWTFDTNAGSIVFDSTSSGFDGQLRNGAFLAAGKIGNSVSLDGANDYVDFGNILNFDETDVFSISAWIYPTDVSKVFQGIVDKLTGAGYRLLLNNGRVYGQVRTSWYGAVQSASSPASSIIEDQWQHVAFTFDGSELKVYLSGTLVETTPFTLPSVGTTGSSLKVGQADNNNRYFEGKIDDVRIYSGTLSAEQICVSAEGTWTGAFCELTELLCNDGADNNLDGFSDCADSDCDGVFIEYVPNVGNVYCEFGIEADCTDTFDNDGDGYLDCNDSDCSSDSICSVFVPDVCGNGVKETGEFCDGTDFGGTTEGEAAYFSTCAAYPNLYVGGLLSCDAACEIDFSSCVSHSTELACLDGFDNDGDGDLDCADSDCNLNGACIDNDGDGAFLNVDCNDNDPLVQNEITCYFDDDNDGFGTTPGNFCIASCAQQGDWVQTAGDCDDTDGQVYPGAPEICADGIDNQCLGDVGFGDVDCAESSCSTDSSCPAALPYTGILGDVNDDGVVATFDAILIQRHNAGIALLTTQEMNRGNVNYCEAGQELLTGFDAILIQRFVAGIITSFPC